MYSVDHPRVIVTPQGGSGTSEGSGTSDPVNGLLAGIYVEFAASSAATTDVIITNNGFPVLTLTDVNTSGYYPVQLQAYSPAGAALTGVYTPLPVAGAFTVAVEDADDEKTVTVTFFVVK